MKIKDLIKELQDTKRWYESLYPGDRAKAAFNMPLKNINEIIEILRQYEELLAMTNNLGDIVDDMLDYTWVEPEKDEHRKKSTKETK